MTEPTERFKGLAKLREPFPPEVIGHLPKGGLTLDFVGHAPTTDRLLSADPEWSWEPLALDDRGLPAYDNAGGLWIKLTVCGVTRLGYGDGPDPKQRIGDAIRNAAMRFGVALDLWAKGDLESALQAPDRSSPRVAHPEPAANPDTGAIEEGEETSGEGGTHLGSPSPDELDAMSVRELADELRNLGLDYQGTKTQLRERLAEAWATT